MVNILITLWHQSVPSMFDRQVKCLKSYRRAYDGPLKKIGQTARTNGVQEAPPNMSRRQKKETKEMLRTTETG